MNKYIFSSGGLGNQMFQYAFYQSLRSSGLNVKFDIGLFSTISMHNGFELDNVFNIKDYYASKSLFHTLYLRLLYKYKPSVLVYKDQCYEYCKDVYDSNKSVYIGDWINEKYFKPIENDIRKMYTFKNILHKNEEIAAFMKSENSVSIHIRRGDYMVRPNYCVCDESYYERAINYILTKIESPIFYIFSDEPIWCTEFMRRFNVKYFMIDWNRGLDSYQDMYLMSQCRHNIIANSTFSWWGSWLNINNDKVVVAPRKWFRNNNLNANCEKWHLIDIN